MDCQFRFEIQSPPGMLEAESSPCEALIMSLGSLNSVDYVVLVCRDLSSARRFYADVLGFNITYERDDWVKFQVGQTALALRPETDFFLGRNVHGPSLQLAFAVPCGQVDTCHNQLRERNVAIVEGPKDKAWGHRTLYFKDTEGNILEIYSELR